MKVISDIPEDFLTGAVGVDGSEFFLYLNERLPVFSIVHPKGHPQLSLKILDVRPFESVLMSGVGPHGIKSSGWKYKVMTNRYNHGINRAFFKNGIEWEVLIELQQTDLIRTDKLQSIGRERNGFPTEEEVKEMLNPKQIDLVRRVNIPTETEVREVITKACEARYGTNYSASHFSSSVDGAMILLKHLTK